MTLSKITLTDLLTTGNCHVPAVKRQLVTVNARTSMCSCLRDNKSNSNAGDPQYTLPRDRLDSFRQNIFRGWESRPSWDHVPPSPESSDTLRPTHPKEYQSADCG
jgi:hypothetical protein